MDFALTEEQEMIRDSAENFLADVSSSAAVRKAMQTEQGYDHQVWQRICEEMVWPAIHIPEAYGGMGLGYVELAVLLEKMGKYLLCSPYFSTVCLGVNALLMAGTEQTKGRLFTQNRRRAINRYIGVYRQQWTLGCVWRASHLPENRCWLSVKWSVSLCARWPHGRST